MTLPRYVAATRPGSRQSVVEADRALARLIADHLPTEPGSGISVHTDDARSRIERAAPESADAVVADVFGGSRVPAHMTSVEYAALGFLNDYAPEPWDPVDSVAWLKAMAWDLRGNMED